MFTVEIAGIAIGIDNKYQYVEEISSDYRTDKAPIFTLFASEAEIDYERSLTEEVFSKEILESTAIYRKMAEKLADYDAFVFHGAVIEIDGKAYLFTAKSGVGKTTHIKLWQKRYGDKVSVLNGDKPVIRIIDGEVFVSGTPWRGKEGYGRPGMARLAGIAFFERSPHNRATSVKSDDVIMKFATQAYIPKTYSAVKTLKLFDKVLSKVPLITLGCNMELDAAEVAYSAFLEAEHN